jgi:hypothetical protein
LTEVLERQQFLPQNLLENAEFNAIDQRWTGCLQELRIELAEPGWLCDLTRQSVAIGKLGDWRSPGDFGDYFLSN